MLSDSSFEKIQIETIIDIFQIDNLTVNSKLDIFNAAVKYVNAQKKNHIPIDIDNNAKPNNNNNIEKTKISSTHQ